MLPSPVGSFPSQEMRCKLYSSPNILSLLLLGAVEALALKARNFGWQRFPWEVPSPAGSVRAGALRGLTQDLAGAFPSLQPGNNSAKSYT